MANKPIDFHAIKTRVSVSDALSFLIPDINTDQKQIRIPCPASKSADNRAIVVSTARNAFCCHRCPRDATTGKKKGGDCIALVAHFKGISMYEAALLLDTAFPPMEKTHQGDHPGDELDFPASGLTAEAFADKLDASDQAIGRFGIIPALCQEVGWMGVANSGINRGKLVLPLRDDFGRFIDFIAVEAVTVPKRWRRNAAK